jgi:uncharacterized protein (TIGR02246 family)
MNRRGTRLLAVSVVVFLVAIGCQREAAAPDTRAADEAAIRTADATTLKAAQAKDVDHVVINYAEDATWLPPNAPTVHGRDAIRAGWAQFLASPNLTIDWQITKLDVSHSGDLAYVLYSYQLTMQGPNGKPISDHGKDLAVWQKQSDGSWKMVADAYNSDLAATPPPPTKSKS